jgi:protein arginine kinase
MDLNNLIERRGEWLRGTGTDADIVMSSRIRLARNLAQFPFLNRADDTVRAEIERTLRRHVTDLSLGGPRSYVDVGHLERLDRQFLVERQLISRELADSHGARAVCFTDEENVSLMVNEEDHLRMQVFHSGFDLDACWQQISRLDDQLEERLPFSFSQELGYLTACPTNAGTGIRVSVLLHLPGLVMTGEVKKVFTALQKINLAVRGLYGEGTQAMGDFYQISNQITLGKAEEKLIRSIKDVVPNIIAYERRVRKALVEDNRAAIHDKIARAYGTLRSAQAISSQETMDLLSSVRMGVNLGFIDDLPLATVNELFLQIQPAHLQKLRKAVLDSGDRNAARAAYLRRRLTDASSASDTSAS